MISINPAGGYMPQMMKRNVRAAYDYCTDHNVSECKVNTMIVRFDMPAQTGHVEYKENKYTVTARFSFAPQL